MHVGPHGLYRLPLGLRVLAGVEARRREVLRFVEGELPIAPELAGDADQRRAVARELIRRSLLPERVDPRPHLGQVFPGLVEDRLNPGLEEKRVESRGKLRL